MSSAHLFTRPLGIMLLGVVLLISSGCGSSGSGTVATGNIAPIANAGPDQQVATGQLVTLTGAGSADANGDSITYSWRFQSLPAGSTATLVNPNTVSPSFTPDFNGFYVLSLVVNDGQVSSPLDTVVVQASLPSFVITTVAGNGTRGFTGDGGLATAAIVYTPSSVAIDTAGTLWFADTDNNRIRKVDAAGVITTVAGTGVASYNGDNQLATAAQIYTPYGLAIDTAGTLWIADTLNNRIRKVDAAGVIATVAGTGTRGYNGDNQLATTAQLNEPTGVAVDAAGNLWIADQTNHRIRKVDAAGVITTVAGTGVGGYNGDNQPATAAQLFHPFGVAIDTAGTLWIADTLNNRIRKVGR